MRAVFVHGACVEDGDWWWHRAAAELASPGVTNSSPGLPSRGETGHPVGVEEPGPAEDVGGTPADRQRRASRTVELDAGHHPFRADPKAVADLVVEST